MSAASPRGMAKTALERATVTAFAMPPSGAAAHEIDEVPLKDGRVLLVDRRTNYVVGTAVNGAQASRTRNFFQ